MSRMQEIEDRLSSLPQGTVVYKTIRGLRQPYLQWTENGKTKSRYIKAGERDEILRKVQERKDLVSELKEMKSAYTPSPVASEYRTNVISGKRLEAGISAVRDFRKRDCFRQIDSFLKAGLPGRVCIVYGLRRTGKTTMLFQAAGSLSEEERSKSAYIKARRTDTMADMDRDLEKLWNQGYRYVFIDEVTLLDDFIDSASMFSDIYAMSGMKIVLSGTDSLGFWFTLTQELYDRAVTVHTTYIPFREYSDLLAIDDIDEYIRYGGTLLPGELAFDDPDALAFDAAFRDDETTRRYIDTAVSENIQHSLLCTRNGNYLRHLRELYEKGELTGAVNRIIESMHHRFLLSTLTDPFKSHDLGSAADLLRKQSDGEKRTRILDEIDRDAVTAELMKMMKIRNREDSSVGITETHVSEIREYLKALDLVVECPRRSTVGESEEYVIFTQPGMRYALAEALVHVLMKNNEFCSFSERERSLATQKILEDVRGRMMEDIVLLDTLRSLPKRKTAFKLTLERSEFDMLIYDSESDTSEAYEVKHSSSIVPRQYHVLEDAEQCAAVEKQYGRITRRCVIYCGPSTVLENGIEYVNVVEYLKGL